MANLRYVANFRFLTLLLVVAPVWPWVIFETDLMNEDNGKRQFMMKTEPP